MSDFLSQLRSAREAQCKVAACRDSDLEGANYERCGDLWGDLANLLVNNAEKIEQLIEAAERWSLESGPGNTASGRTMTRRALDALNGERV